MVIFLPVAALPCLRSLLRSTYRCGLRAGDWARSAGGAILRSDMSEIQESYKKQKPVLRRTAKRLRSMLKEVVKTIEDKALVRAELSRVRIKDLSSLRRKAETNGWPTNQALFLCSDLVGGRVVCNNVEDTYRFAELLKERLASPWDKFEVQDHIKVPNRGYRALHINFRLDVGQHPPYKASVPCEVQIRSRLQDAWAELSHNDIYKQPDLPEDLRGRANDLSEVIAAADRIASSIRSRVSQASSTPTHCPDLRRVTSEGLAFCFKQIFGRSAPDYVIRQGLNQCDKLGIVSLEDFPDLLARTEPRNRIDAAYQSIIGIKIQHEDLFLAVLYSFAKGKSNAIKWIKKQARRELDEINQIVRRETLASLPETIEDLVESLSNLTRDTEIEEWAIALRSNCTCPSCGVSIVQTHSFTEAALQHYAVQEKDVDSIWEQIEDALSSSEIEDSDGGDGSLCMCCEARLEASEVADSIRRPAFRGSRDRDLNSSLAARSARAASLDTQLSS